MKIFKFISVLVLIILLGILFSACVINQIDCFNSIDLSNSEEVIGELYFIGLPDGVPFVSIYDKDNNYYSKIPIDNIRIQSDDIEKYYGKKYPLKFDAEARRAVSMPYFITMTSIFSGLLLLDIIGGIFVLRHIVKH